MVKEPLKDTIMGQLITGELMMSNKRLGLMEK
jgi:hypothetical protein